MADYTFRANLSAPNIPTNPILFGRSVVIKDRDQNYSPNLASKSDRDKDAGIPQVMYCANVLPTDFGFRSVGFFGSQETCPGTPYIAFPIRSTTDSATLIHTTEGGLYRLKKVSEGPEVPEFSYVGTYVGALTYAHVAGTTYIYISKVGCYKYNFTTKLLESVTLAGLEPTEVIGVTATGGYLLAWSADAIAWSSLIDPTDMVPSLDTGAGGGSVEGAKGALTVCVSNSYGIYIFTEANCVSAQLSNNARYPFNFREIVGSSGLTNIQSVSYEGNQNTAYAFTSIGFEQISHNGAKNVWTDLYENALNTPISPTISTLLTASPAPVGADGKIQEAKIVTVASRYVCVSVKNREGTYYNQVWVFDLALERWGRILKDHYEVFEDEYYNIGIITTDGRYLTVDSPFATYPTRVEADVGYLMLGRYQYSRARFTNFQSVALDNLYTRDLYDTFGNKYGEDVYPDVYLASSLDGKTGTFEQMYRRDSEYLKTASAINHTLLIVGYFDLDSAVLTVSQGGGR
jgi:hypothetical protein